MALRSEQRVIDGITFITSQLPVLDGLMLWSRIGKLVAPAVASLREVDQRELGELFKKLGEDVAELDLALAGDIMGAFGPAIVELFSALDPVELRRLTKDMLATTTAITSNPAAKYELGQGDVAINAALGGNLGTLVKALVWIGRFNFSSFFPGSLGSSDDVVPMKASR